MSLEIVYIFSTSDSKNADVLLLSKVRNLLPHPLPIRSLLPLAVIDLPIQSNSRQKGADVGADAGGDAGADSKSCDLSEPIRE